MGMISPHYWVFEEAFSAAFLSLVFSSLLLSSTWNLIVVLFGDIGAPKHFKKTRDNVGLGFHTMLYSIGFGFPGCA